MKADKRKTTTTPDQHGAARPKRGLSCRHLVGLAILLSVLFVAARLAGFREYTAVLSATDPSSELQMLCGLVYVMLHLCLFGLVPILLIAAGLLKAGALLKRGRMIGNGGLASGRT